MEELRPDDRNWLFFTPHEADVVREAMALLVPGPADAPGEPGPGAREADAVRYADRLLGAFTVEPPLVYASGRPDGSFLPLTPAQRTGWRRRVSDLRRAYRTGVTVLDRLAGGDFASASPASRHRALCDAEAAVFRDQLFDHAVEGTYGAPVYRGRPAPANPTLLGLPAPRAAGTATTPAGPPRTDPPEAVGPYAGPGPDPVAVLARHFTRAARLIASSGGYGG
ncbi:hypothetical protein ACFYYY_25810 [Streptomyces sp. NPDC001834]|uniref:hypothetical protein n=1 Tax=Streptomyces sp. NPDC001834 TaxID=3364616 RepID=UPI00368A7EED